MCAQQLLQCLVVVFCFSSYLKVQYRCSSCPVAALESEQEGGWRGICCPQREADDKAGVCVANALVSSSCIRSCSRGGMGGRGFAVLRKKPMTKGECASQMLPPKKHSPQKECAQVCSANVRQQCPQLCPQLCQYCVHRHVLCKSMLLLTMTCSQPVHTSAMSCGVQKSKLTEND